MRAYTTIYFNMYDTSAKDTATVSCTQSQTDVSDLLSDEMDHSNYASTETNGLYLDGSYSYLNSGVPLGLYSNVVSGSDGSFSSPVTLIFTFSEDISTSGITLYFPKDEYPETVKITWYNGTNILSSKYFHPDKMIYVRSESVENYDKVVLEFESLINSGHWLKLTGIQFGQAFEFGIDKLTKASLAQETDLMCDEIPISTLDFEVEDKEGLFNITNTGNVFFAAQANQEIAVYTELTVGEETTNIFIGKYYLQDLSEKTITAKFKAQDIIGLLDGVNQPEGYWNTTFQNYCATVLDGYDYEIETSSLNTVAIKGYLPACSKREALQQACFVAGAIATSEGSDKLRIYQPDDSNVLMVSDDGIYAGGYIESQKLYQTLNITVHSFDSSGTDNPVDQIVELNRRGSGTITISDAVFVNRDNVNDVVRRIKDHCTQRVKYNFSMPLVSYPDMAGTMMAYLNNSSQYVKGSLSKMNVNLASGFRADMTIEGLVKEVTYGSYAGELYAEAGYGGDIVGGGVE